MKSRILMAFSFILFQLNSFDINALSIEAYREIIKTGKDRDSTFNYINGVGEGFGWYSTFLVLEGETALYCPPKGIIKATDYVNILNEGLITYQGMTAKVKNVEPILLYSLIEKFPCKK